ncbi:hypothetical protein H696_01238 [Fonticula alba]|uniref:Vacuolar fusion protein MON1 homolog n=1 Tax=Fonticula alba TaxID=691883 RepID=A0A058ZBM0_FONAL|nr:hypothetical protein H696_01238 [Fonticula alba]KCV71820.1 hypothetical protein H696_01238 [Fonticula alba]|eukprot:XP_009493398.1 hypothetical protein H696_01238 [Fonticula alba]
MLDELLDSEALSDAMLSDLGSGQVSRSESLAALSSPILAAGSMPHSPDARTGSSDPVAAFAEDMAHCLGEIARGGEGTGVSPLLAADVAIEAPLTSPGPLAGSGSPSVEEGLSDLASGASSDSDSDSDSEAGVALSPAADSRATYLPHPAGTPDSDRHSVGEPGPGGASSDFGADASADHVADSTPTPESEVSSEPGPVPAPVAAATPAAVPPIQNFETQRKHGDEDTSWPSWSRRKKHFFILSSSGKPIYSFHGNEGEMSTMMGFLQAFISLFLDSRSAAPPGPRSGAGAASTAPSTPTGPGGDPGSGSLHSVDFQTDAGLDMVRAVKFGRNQIVFLLKQHIYLVAVSRLGEPELHLRQQLQYLYSHLVSVLSVSQIHSIFSNSQNYDLRNLLNQADTARLDSLARRMEREPMFWLNTVPVFPMQATLREALVASIQRASEEVQRDRLLATLVIHKYSSIITASFSPRYPLYTSDVHLIMNTVASKNLQHFIGVWLPICLPRFNPTAFLFAYVSTIETAPDICVVILSTDPSGVDSAQRTSNNIQSSILEILRPMHDAGGLGGSSMQWPLIWEYAGFPSFTPSQMSPHDIKGSLLGFLRHYVYISSATRQHHASPWITPYSIPRHQRRLLRMYRHAHQMIHTRTRPLRMFWTIGSHEIVVGWRYASSASALPLAADPRGGGGSVQDNFEMYLAFAPHTRKDDALSTIEILMRWVALNEKNAFMPDWLAFAV